MELKTYFTSDFRFQISEGGWALHLSQISDFRFQKGGVELKTDFRFQVSDFRFQKGVGRYT